MCRGEADVIEPPLVVVKPEQKRAHLAPALQVAEAADHAIGGAEPLHLDHAVPLAGAVGQVGPLRHHPVLAAVQRIEPMPGQGEVARDGRKRQRRVAQAGHQPFERGATIGQRPGRQVVPLCIRQQIENLVTRRIRRREFLHPARRRMQPQLQFLEGRRPRDVDHQLAVQDEAWRRDPQQGGHDIGEIAAERLAGFRAQLDGLAVTEGEAAEPVPFRLVLPSRALGQARRAERFHGRVGEGERQRHAPRTSGRGARLRRAYMHRAMNHHDSDNILPRDGEAVLVPDAIPRGQADRLFARLTHALAWRSEVALVVGRRIALPRLTAWYGEGAYTYSGIRNPPAAWTDDLLEAKAVAERCAGIAFNSVLANLYRDGRDSVSWHADDESVLGEAPVIASLSFGAVRRFRLRHKSIPSLSVALDLPHGSCLVMAGATQRHWLHQVPKTARPVGPRINLTFRRCVPAN